MGASPRICLTGILLILQIYLSAQEKASSIINAPIPDSLTKGADAVCLLDEMAVEILSVSKMTMRERHIYKILNRNAEYLANYETEYDKLTNINFVNGRLFNDHGAEIKSFKKKDMSDRTNDGDAFVSDDRMKVDGFSYNAFPYTVEFEEEDEKAGTMYLPSWTPPRSGTMSVKLSRFIVTVPTDYKFRTKQFFMDIKPVVSENKGKTTYTWEIRNLPVAPDEPLAVSSNYYNPEMLVGPNEFELEGYRGNGSTWEEYGKFYASLYRGKDVLPDDLKRQVHLLTDNINDPYKKIAVLYDYLQKNTHYVLIMFGIGGWQPYDASYVAKNKYGDCKALSNFMVALLKEAGIKGFPVAIHAGANQTDFVVDFPRHQGNHIICMVPIKQDTVWLECTSQSSPPGYLTAFTCNRYGLTVDETGGKLVHTPRYELKDNTSTRKISASLDMDGNLRIKSETDYKALKYDHYMFLTHDLSKSEQLEHLKGSFGLSTYTINSFNYTEDNSLRLPVIHEALDITASGYARVTGKRIFIDPDILQKSTVVFPEENERKLDFLVKNEFRETDSVEIIIPAGYTTESKPRDLLLETQYGRFQVQTEVRDGRILYYRHFDQYLGHYAAAQLNSIRDFYNGIYAADRAQIVLVKK
jgi:transglutaminase-like putative cysteine protease